MSQMKSRRELALLATGGVIATGLIAAGTKPALADQGFMLRARAQLNDALQSLQQADDNKGGHKVTAVRFIQQAIDEVNAGIEYSNHHGG
jgi:hypothetical protein